MNRSIVIGATSGIGRGLAECFAAQGYAVGLVGRRENLLKEIAQADPAAYRFAVADVTRPAETVAALECLVRELGGMDLCVVSAGTGDLNPSLNFSPVVFLKAGLFYSRGRKMYKNHTERK